MKVPIIIFMFIIWIASGCAATPKRIETFVMDYPHGGQRILVKSTREAYLFYGARPTSKIIRRNTFSVNELYQLFRKHLYANVPREEWPNPGSQFGMVTVKYSDGKQVDFLIFDMPEFTKKIFDKAQKNIEGDFE